MSASSAVARTNSEYTMAASSPSSAVAAAAGGGGEGGGGVQGEDHSPLLPGLPDDVALRCLAFVPRLQHALLRCVCTRWRALVTKGLSSFHALRRSMGLTQNYLFLIPNDYFHPDTLPFFEIDPQSTSTVRKGSLYTPLREDEEAFLTGHACISMGPFVLILGGLFADSGALDGVYEKSSGQLHIFDTASVAWWRGADMLFPRCSFAWGVIEDRLYVAGGLTDDYGGPLQQVEMYDFDADCWSRVADMPMCLYIDIFFVYKGALYVCGYISDYRDEGSKLFSYRPSLNQWKEEEWMLGNVLKNLKPDTTNQITTLQNNEDDTLYMLEIQTEEEEDAPDPNYGDSGAYLKVLKRAPNMSEWKEVFSVFDEVLVARECSCPAELIYRRARFPSIGKQVVVMGHSEICDVGKDVNVQISQSGEVLMVSLTCPSNWDAAVIHA